MRALRLLFSFRGWLFAFRLRQSTVCHATYFLQKAFTSYIHFNGKNIKNLALQAAEPSAIYGRNGVISNHVQIKFMS